MPRDDSSESDQSNQATPLPWTNGGPKEHNNQQQATPSQAVADINFIYKGKVIDMKRMEKIKASLPDGVDLRIAKNGELSFRARFRMQGYPERSKTFSDKDLAESWLNEHKRAATIGLHLPAYKPELKTLKDAIEKYLKQILPLKPKNARNTKRHLLFWIKELGDYALTAITPELIGNIRDRMLQEEISPGKLRAGTTVTRYLGAISHLFSVAKNEWGWINENPVSKVRKPSPSPGRTRFLSQNEINTLLQSCKESPCVHLYPIVVLGLSTGMRSGEIHSLTWKQIDFQHNQIILPLTKNNEPRAVPLVGYAYDTLFQLYDSQPGEALLFPSPTIPKKPLDTRKAWKNALKRANLNGNDIVLHTLRHTTASHLALKGKSLHDIASLLGHKDLKVTRRYAKLTNPYKSQMVNELNREFFHEQ